MSIRSFSLFSLGISGCACLRTSSLLSLRRANSSGSVAPASNSSNSSILSVKNKANSSDEGLPCWLGGDCGTSSPTTPAAPNNSSATETTTPAGDSSGTETTTPSSSASQAQMSQINKTQLNKTQVNKTQVNMSKEYAQTMLDWEKNVVPHIFPSDTDENAELQEFGEMWPFTSDNETETTSTTPVPTASNFSLSNVESYISSAALRANGTESKINSSETFKSNSSKFNSSTNVAALANFNALKKGIFGDSELDVVTARKEVVKAANGGGGFFDRLGLSAPKKLVTQDPPPVEISVFKKKVAERLAVVKELHRPENAEKLEKMKKEALRRKEKKQARIQQILKDQAEEAKR